MFYVRLGLFSVIFFWLFAFILNVSGIDPNALIFTLVQVSSALLAGILAGKKGGENG